MHSRTMGPHYIPKVVLPVFYPTLACLKHGCRCVYSIENSEKGKMPASLSRLFVAVVATPAFEFVTDTDVIQLVTLTLILVDNLGTFDGFANS